MLYELLYNCVLISGTYFTFDIFGKIQQQQITNINDVKMYFVFKGVNMLNLYNSCKKDIDTVVSLCRKKENDDNESDDEYKLVMIKNNGSVLKFLLQYENDVFFLKNKDECLDNVKTIFLTNKHNKRFIQIDNSEIVDGRLKSLKNKLENVNADDKLFLNVQLINGEDNLDLNHILNKYYVVGNKIMDKSFLEYILSENYDVPLVENYKLTMIDKDILMFDIDNSKGIEVTEEDGLVKYKIVDSVDETDENE